MLVSALLLAAAALTTAAAPAPPPSAEAYVGRWNVLLTDTGDTFRGAWFKIEKQADGGLSAQMVWRWASVVPVKARLKGGRLVLVREEKPGQRDVFLVHVAGLGLKGQVHYADGKVHHFEARRAPELARTSAVKWGAPVTLFDGKTLDGWRLREPKAKLGWAAQNGELAVVDPQGNADLVTEQTFQDLRLQLEFNVEPKSNSGVYLRGRYEIQILDDPQLATESHGCGALYSRIAPALDATQPAGVWQRLDLTFVGRRLTVELNGKTIIDDAAVEGITGGALNPFEGEPGPLMLQGDHGKVRFRNIVVTPAL